MSDSKARNIILNALTLNILHELFDYLTEINIKVTNINLLEIPFNDCISYVGHKDLIEVVKNEASKLGKEINIELNRSNYKYAPGDVIYIIQYIGDRLPEGSKSLPENAKLKYFKATIHR